MTYAEKKRSGEQMYGPAPTTPVITNTQEWDSYRAGRIRRANRHDLLLPNGDAARYTGKHRPLSKRCPCNVCTNQRGSHE